MTMKLIFQMACILCPECNFLHRYFRCQLPEEMVDVEVKVKTMQSIPTFRRDRTSQVIKCNPWSTRLHLYPSLIWKIKTYLEYPAPNPATTNPAATNPYATKPTETHPTKHKHQSQEIPRAQNKCYRKKKKSHGSQKKVQGKGTHPAYTFHPNLNCTYPQGSHC